MYRIWWAHLILCSKRAIGVGDAEGFQIHKVLLLDEMSVSRPRYLQNGMHKKNYSP